MTNIDQLVFLYKTDVLLLLVDGYSFVAPCISEMTMKKIDLIPKDFDTYLVNEYCKTIEVLGQPTV